MRIIERSFVLLCMYEIKTKTEKHLTKVEHCSQNPLKILKGKCGGRLVEKIKYAKSRS
jgi:hypothetical protein